MQKFAFGSSLAAATVLSVIASATAPAQALTFVGGTTYSDGFANIPNPANTGEAAGDGIVGAFRFTIEQDSSNVLFKIFNNVLSGNNSRISEVYFDDPLGLLSYSNGVNTGNSGTVFFAGPSTDPSNLPQGNRINFTADFGFGGVRTGSGQSAISAATNGINPGEALGIRFGLTTGTTYQQVLNALNTHDLRLGLHVQNVPGGGSDAYATIPTPALLPGLLGLGVGIIRKRKKLALESSES